MALPASGPLSLDDIQTEFGGANPIGINEYYGAAAGIPASGTISINDFYGASASPAGLITASDIGGFYDFSDTSSLWQNTTGTIPVTAAGQPIKRIDDKSVKGNHLTQSVGTVTWSSSYGAGNFTNDSLERSLSTSIGSFTVIMALTQNTQTNSIMYSFTNGLPNPNRLSAHLPWGDNNYYWDTYNATTGRIQGTRTVALASPMVSTHRRNGSAVIARVNGSLFGSTTISTAVSANQINIGGENNYMNGRINAFFFINRALSDAEVQSVENWMAAKNGAF